MHQVPDSASASAVTDATSTVGYNLAKQGSVGCIVYPEGQRAPPRYPSILWLEATTIRLEAIAIRFEAVPIRLEAIALRLEARAIASRLEASILYAFQHGKDLN